MAAAAAAKVEAKTELPLAFTQVSTAAEQYPVAVAQRAADLCAAADRAVIGSQADLEQGATLDKMIQAALKKGEDERTKLTGPLNAVVKMLNAKFKTVSEPLEKSRQIIQRKMVAYNAEQQRIAQEAAALEAKRIADEALATASALAESGYDKEADEVLAEAIEAPPAMPPAPAGPVRSDVGAVTSFVDDPKWELVNLADVPREWLTVDEKKINQSVKKDGVRAIPGLKIWVDQRVVTR